MSLDEFPIALILAGLTAYAVLGGADFGAGFWSLPAGGRRGEERREFAHHAMGPVWEANHVWLIFVLVVCWTAYPSAFASIMSTLAVPFFIAAVGIILRGTAYALRVGTGRPSEQRSVDVVFALSSILTPFALGAALGAIASSRVPVGNAEGDLFSSWLNPTSFLVGVLAVCVSAYLAAVYLAADGVRMGKPELAESFRVRALATGVVAGAVAMGGLLVVRDDAPELWDGLTEGAGLAAVIVSACAGAATMLLVWRRRYDAARPTAAAAVAAVVLGWAFAQRPEVLPGLDVHQAAAGRSTLIALVIATAIGAIVLVPSLILLYGLLLEGRFERAPTEPVPRAREPRAGRSKLLPAAAAFLGIGALLTLGFDAGAPLAIGVTCLLTGCVLGFAVLASPLEEAER